MADNKIVVPGAVAPEADISLAPRREEIREVNELVSYALWRRQRMLEILQEDALASQQDQELLIKLPKASK